MTSGEPVATLDPQATGSPILPACLLFTITVGLPAANTEAWHALSQQCVAQPSPCLCQGRPFTITSGDPATLGLGGNHGACPRHSS